MVAPVVDDVDPILAHVLHLGQMGRSRFGWAWQEVEAHTELAILSLQERAVRAMELLCRCVFMGPLKDN